VPDATSPFLESAVDPDPFAQFRRWYADAEATVAHPEAVAVATADRYGRPSVRMVLMKAFDDRGPVFYTNYSGRKGRELDENPHAALLFHWNELGRQVRLEGPVERVTAEESDAYFGTRPRGAQVAANASAQSEVIADRDALNHKVRDVASRYEGAPVPRPDDWGGYRLRPTVFEFWQGQADRLHDRLRYQRDEEGWRLERLQP
jgi:pyridoxamine-phosphate oxidase